MNAHSSGNPFTKRTLVAVTTELGDWAPWHGKGQFSLVFRAQNMQLEFSKSGPC